jgi:hypothetical protein
MDFTRVNQIFPSSAFAVRRSSRAKHAYNSFEFGMLETIDQPAFWA